MYLYEKANLTNLRLVLSSVIDRDPGAGIAISIPAAAPANLQLWPGLYPQNTQENSKIFACGGLNYLKFLIKNCI